VQIDAGTMECLTVDQILDRYMPCAAATSV
jgi:hypothetical protein